MTVEDTQEVLTFGELSVGDRIETWHNGKLFHRGEVIRTVAATDLFWILDERTGIRRLIDAEVSVIRRAAVPAATPDPAAPAPPIPASYVPLFQAPSLAP